MPMSNSESRKRVAELAADSGDGTGEAIRLPNVCTCGDCYHPLFGPNTDGDPCDWCQDCGCPSANHHPAPVLPPAPDPDALTEVERESIRAACGEGAWGLFAAVQRILSARDAVQQRIGAEKALREAAQSFQINTWADVVTPALKTQGLPALAVAQAVVDWLRDRADRIAREGQA